MISMNYFQRNVREALASLRQQFVTLTQNKTSGDYFLALNFQDLDKMKLYMFKIYQLTQKVAYDSYIKSVLTLTTEYSLFAIMFLLSYLTLFAFWIRVYQKEKKELSRIYARLLLIPFNILKTNMRIVNSFKEAIEYQENWFLIFVVIIRLKLIKNLYDIFNFYGAFSEERVFSLKLLVSIYFYDDELFIGRSTILFFAILESDFLMLWHWSFDFFAWFKRKQYSFPFFFSTFQKLSF